MPTVVLYTTQTRRPRRPLLADLAQPFLSNFGTGVGLHIWEGGVRLEPAFTASTGGGSSDSSGGSGGHARPWYVAGIAHPID